MTYSGRKTLISISPDIFLHVSLLLLVLPLRWILAMIIAAAIHELGHLCAAKALGVSVNRISVGISGAVIQTGPMNTGEEMICALAGPLTGLIVVCSFRAFPELLLCALMQTAYNLIPVYPFDGARVLRCLLLLLFTRDQADKVMQVISYLILASVIVVSLLLLYFCFQKDFL